MENNKTPNENENLTRSDIYKRNTLPRLHFWSSHLDPSANTNEVAYSNHTGKKTHRENKEAA